jgi:hypothetical protein
MKNVCAENCFARCTFKRHIPLPASSAYKGMSLDCLYRLDVLADKGCCKQSQRAISFMTLDHCLPKPEVENGLLINFNRTPKAYPRLVIKKRKLNIRSLPKLPLKNSVHLCVLLCSVVNRFPCLSLLTDLTPHPIARSSGRRGSSSPA